MNWIGGPQRPNAEQELVKAQDLAKTAENLANNEDYTALAAAVAQVAQAKALVAIADLLAGIQGELKAIRELEES